MYLSVSLNQVLHEIDVVEAHRASVVLVHRGDLGHFGVGEGEVEVLMQNNGNSTKSEFRFFGLCFGFWRRCFYGKHGSVDNEKSVFLQINYTSSESA